jgi:hypothetical protein
MSWWGEIAIIAELGLILIVLGALYYRAAGSEAARAASPGSSPVRSSLPKARLYYHAQSLHPASPRA